MDSEPLWKLTHELHCPYYSSKNIDPTHACICIPEKRIHIIKHILAGCTLDPSVREAMVREIEKCDCK